MIFVRKRLPTVFLCATALAVCFLMPACSQTEIVESPKTGFVSESTEPTNPDVIWTSRTLTQHFDYLGLVKSRSWTYDGALDLIVQAGRDLRADAVIDVHYQRIGFLNTMQAFAIKYK